MVKWRWQLRKVVSKLENDNDDDVQMSTNFYNDDDDDNSWSLIMPFLGSDVLTYPDPV